ncbi:ribonuclease P protein component [Methylobacterium sp. A54F]
MSTIERLRRRSEFLAAAKGRRFHTEHITAQGRLRDADEIRDGQPAAGLHLGYTLTKRVGHATERNRIRRRLRAAVAAVAPDLPAAPADIVLVGRRPALGASFETLKDEVRRAVTVVVKPSSGARRKEARRSPGEAASRPTPDLRGAGNLRAPSPGRHACDGTSDGQ